MVDTLKKLFVVEYADALKRYHPDLQITRIVDGIRQAGAFEMGGPNRYRKPTLGPSGGIPAWGLSNLSRKRTIGNTYKGLLCHKAPIDLVLYSALIWEIEPPTIIELGSFHGGSGLWFADQMAVMSKSEEVRGEVHSFDLLSDCVSERAKGRPGLYFHHADLNNLKTMDAGLLKRLPHPWLVVDDAHVNVLNTLCFMRRFMSPGDYFIKEDMEILGSPDAHAEYARVAESVGFMVDSIYTDAFGTNHTTAQNAWFVLDAEASTLQPTSEDLPNMTWEKLA